MQSQGEGASEPELALRVHMHTPLPGRQHTVQMSNLWANWHQIHVQRYSDEPIPFKLTKPGTVLHRDLGHIRILCLKNTAHDTVNTPDTHHGVR